MDLTFYKNRRVLVTGHTGFKGSWMCCLLAMAGAEVTGYALEPPAGASLFELCHLADRINSVIGDIRDLRRLAQAFEEAQPQVVIHMAAQPLVRDSYKDPVHTYDVNVMGTVHLLECVRGSASVKSVVNVTTDKVYRNREWEWGYRENEELNGYDPYSNSKSCSELVTSSYVHSFFQDRDVAISTARAGNVIGGGDFADNRILPDCIRAIEAKRPIVVRNPDSVRPYQYVLEPIMAYLAIAKEQYGRKEMAGSYNIGPEDRDSWSTRQLVSLFCKEWESQVGQAVPWVEKSDGGPHESNYLKLDCSKIEKAFGWKPQWDMAYGMKKVVEWFRCYFEGEDAAACMERQIREFCKWMG